MKKTDCGFFLGEPLKTDGRSCKWSFPGAGTANRFYLHGLFLKNDFTINLTGLRFLVFDAEAEAETVLSVKLRLLRDRSPEPEAPFFTQACVPLSAGRRQVCVPIKAFDLPESQSFSLQFCREIEFSADRKISVGKIRFVKGLSLALECTVRSKAAESGATVRYAMSAVNCTGEQKRVVLSRKPYGWETMDVQIDPAVLILPPYGKQDFTVSVRVSERAAPGGCEKQTILAQDGSGREERIRLITCRALPHPCVLVDSRELEKIRKKIQTYDWPKKTLAVWRSYADGWLVPEIDPEKPYLFLSEHSERSKVAACLYALTGEKTCAEKVVRLLKETADPQKGYPRLPKFTHQELVHEGECFRNLAVSYDLVYGSGLLSQDDHKNIERVFRLFMDLIDRELRKGELSNWTLAETTGALFCACALQDRALMERFLFGVGGAAEHLSRGVLDDGWWYEASIGYNLLAAGLFSEIAQAAAHFGINFADLKVPASFAESVNSAAALKGGLCNEIWGPNHKNYRCVKMLWDSLIPCFDYRGVIFGINDSIESDFIGITKRFEPRYDLAYHIYRDPAYALLLKRLPPEKRDLLFGTGAFPENSAPPQYAACACFDNAGAAVLRSQAPGRQPREQIQAVLKYGSHGGAHGHYDRASLTSLMRYGRSLFNPENVWYSYHTYLYKFYVQNSVTHNMVTADLKQQDPAEPRRLLFYSGKALQACAVENFGKWCNPPYGGWKVGSDATFEQRVWNEGRSIEIPADHPEYSSRSGFTENILTRRLLLVADDYVLVYDCAEGREDHDYDCLYHLQGLKDISENCKLLRHTEKLEDNPLSSAQFITDCDWYAFDGGAKLHFETAYTETRNNGSSWLTKNRTGMNEPGTMKTDLYLLDPSGGEFAVGYPPEFEKGNKQLFYRVEADGETLASGSFGAWIFGREFIDADVRGKKELTLTVSVRDVDYEEGFPQHAKDTVFWGDPYFVTESGETVFLSQLPYLCGNTKKGFGPGVDYEGGPVKIQTRQYRKAIPAEPEDRAKDGVITVSLKGLRAVRFYSAIGGDYPVGGESDRRRTVMLRRRGKSSSFITLLEPYEKQPSIKSVSQSGGSVTVELRDGRTQRITVTGLRPGTGALTALLEEYENGRPTRTETAACPDKEQELSEWNHAKS